MAREYKRPMPLMYKYLLFMMVLFFKFFIFSEKEVGKLPAMWEIG